MAGAPTQQASRSGVSPRAAAGSTSGLKIATSYCPGANAAPARLFYGCAAILFFICPLAIAAETAHWPQFRGAQVDGMATGSTLPETWSSTENLAWKTELPGAGTSSPVLFGKKIFLTCYSGYNVPGKPAGDMEQLRRHVVCLDRKDGNILWKTEIQNRLPEQERIRENHGYASSTPAVDEERLYVFFGKSGVFAFDHDGKELWKADVGSRLNSWGSAASPVRTHERGHQW